MANWRVGSITVGRVLWFFAAVAAAALLSLSQPVFALHEDTENLSYSSGVATRHFQIDEAIERGGKYSFGTFTVGNTGDLAASFEFRARSSSTSEHASNSKWFKFFPPSVYLEPNQNKDIEFQIHVPVNAEPGAYITFLEVVPVPDENNAGANIRVAGMRLNFTIAPTPTRDAILLALNSGLLSLPNVVVVVSGFLFVLLAIIVTRFFVKKYNYTKTAHGCLLIIVVLYYAFLMLRIMLPKDNVAGTSNSVSVNVLVQMCGDGLVMGTEDCEDEDLNGQTCSSLGYGGGTLSCDPSCTFDTSECLPPTPTPTPVPTPTPAPTPTPEPTPKPPSSATPTPTPVSDPGSSSLIADLPIVRRILDPEDTDGEKKALLRADIYYLSSPDRRVPQKLSDEFSKFDHNGNNRIDHDQALAAIELWAEHWRAQRGAPSLTLELIAMGITGSGNFPVCDLNLDNTCNGADFSILLHMIENQ